MPSHREFGGAEKALHPRVHVVRAHPVAEGRHPGLPLVGLHGQRTVERRGHGIDVERVHHQRFLQLLRGPRHFGEHEHAVQGHLGHHVFLGHQVHAVPQRGDQRHVRRAIQGYQFLGGQRTDQVADRRPSGFGEPPVDAPHRLVDLPLELRILGHALPARHQELREHDVPAVLRPSLEQPLHREQPLVDALGVVQPVDAEDFPRPITVPGTRPRRFGHRGDVVRVDADRVGDRRHGASVVFDLTGVAVHVAAQQARRSVQEMIGVAVHLEPHDVGAEHATQQPARPGKHPENVGGGEGDVQERRDPRLRYQLPQVVRRAQELVVLHPDQLSRARERRGLLREPLVDRVVHAPRIGVDPRAAHEVVEQRPQRAVGESGVVLRQLVRRERNRFVAHVAIPGHFDVVRLRHLFPPDAGPPDPDPAALPQHRIERAHQPARRAAERDPSPLPLGLEGQPVADDDQPLGYGRRPCAGLRSGCAFHVAQGNALARAPEHDGSAITVWYTGGLHRRACSRGSARGAHWRRTTGAW